MLIEDKVFIQELVRFILEKEGYIVVTTSSIPIIIMSACDDAADKVIGLELGTDDYITKPFNPRELTAGIKARLREEKNEMN